VQILLAADAGAADEDMSSAWGLVARAPIEFKRGSVVGDLEVVRGGAELLVVTSSESMAKMSVGVAMNDAGGRMQGHTGSISLAISSPAEPEFVTLRQLHQVLGLIRPLIRGQDSATSPTHLAASPHRAWFIPSQSGILLSRAVGHRARMA
jgi:hypothetical protein